MILEFHLSDWDLDTGLKDISRQLAKIEWDGDRCACFERDMSQLQQITII
jgi:hypothetical protein